MDREKAALREPNGKKIAVTDDLSARARSARRKIGVLNKGKEAGCRHSRREAPLYVVSIEVATIFRARYSAREKS